MGSNGQEIEIHFFLPPGALQFERRGILHWGPRGPKPGTEAALSFTAFWSMPEDNRAGLRSRFGDTHSVRSATIGSTRMARRAGRKQARAAKAARSRVTRLRLSGSKG